MKIKLLVLAFVAGIGLFCQESDKIPGIIRVYDWSVYGGISYDYTTVGSTEDFNTLAPGAGLMDIIFPEDYISSGWFGAVYLNPTINGLAGIRFYSKKKNEYLRIPSLRIGLSYSRINSLSGRIWYSSAVTIDTLVSTNTGQEYYLDSAVTESYWLNYSAHMLRLDFSGLLRFNSDGRWSFYTGLGFSGGLSFFANTDIDHNTFTETQLQKEDQSQYVLGLFENEHYRRRNKMSFNIAWFVPVGVDFRLGKKSDLGKRTHLFYEMRPGVNFVSIPELRMIKAGNFQQGLGFRLEI